MDDFDDEPSTGGGYERVISKPIEDMDGIPRRIVMRFRGRPIERVSVVLEELRDGVTGAMMRYDDAHGCFHRHVPGWPEPSNELSELLDFVPRAMRAAFADREIHTSYTIWEADVFGETGDMLP